MALRPAIINEAQRRWTTAQVTLTVRFAFLSRAGVAPPGDIPDFTALIAERTRDFTGREWVFAAIDAWLADSNGPPFFIITGEPGSGKTAIAARLTQIRDLAVHHFCIARQAATIDSLAFVRSVWFQLAHRYGVFSQEEPSLNVRVKQSISSRQPGGEAFGIAIQHLDLGTVNAKEAFTQRVLTPLKAIAGSIDRPLVILIDALDEAELHQGSETIVDLLASAQDLPGQVRFVLTTRPTATVLSRFEQHQSYQLLLDTNSSENQADLRAYIDRQLNSSTTLQARLAEQGLSEEVFAKRAQMASQGNFLYLVSLLKEATAGKLHLDQMDRLPSGLSNLYREFLRKLMIGKGEETFARYQKILSILAASREPLSLEQITTFAHLQPQDVQVVLDDLAQFLSSETKGYQLYHASLREFLTNEELAGEFWIDLRLIYRDMAAHHHEKGNQQGEANTLLKLGRLLRARGEEVAAQESYQQALMLYRQIGDRQGEAGMLIELGRTRGLQGERAETLDYYQQALMLYRQIGDREGEANALTAINDVQPSQDNPNQAPAKSERNHPMLCPKCNQELASGAKFCSNCGTPIAQVPGIAVSQDIGTVSGSVTGVAAGKGGIPGGISVKADQKVNTVEDGGAVAGVVFGGEAPVHVGGHQQYGDSIQGDKVVGDRINVGDITGSSGVAIGAGAQSTVRTVHTSGGDYAEGSIDKRRGSFVQGSQTTISGVTGSNINVGSTLTNVSQSIGAIAHGDDATKAELQQLIAQLNAALQRLPATQAAEAEAVAELTKQTVDQATKPQPNRMLVQISAEGLKQAAQNLAGVFPVALKVAELVLKLVA